MALVTLAFQIFWVPAWAAVAPATPNITEPGANGQVVSGADVHMETAPFVDLDGDHHRCTDWEIWTAGFTERVWSALCVTDTQLRVHIHLGDGVFEGSHAGRTSLLPARDYDLRVRHRSDSGDPATEWSAYALRRFHTDIQRQPLPGAPEWIVAPGFVVEEVARGFQLPVSVVPVASYAGGPSQPMLYVTELYGRIKVIKGDLSVGIYADNLLNFDPTGQFPGSGEQGLTGLVVEPASGDLFASLLYESGGSHHPRVVRFHSTDGGLTAASQTTVLDMPGEVQGPSHQISNLTFGPDGKLYVHLGDGFAASTARDLESFQGKILRVNLNGSAPSDNPFFNGGAITARDYVYAYGFRNPFGGAWRAADNRHYEVENGPSIDRLVRVARGTDYGWDGTNASIRTNALYVWDPAHAPVNIDFVEPSRFHASGFPDDKRGHAFVSESGPTYATGPQNNGKRIVEFVFNANGTVQAPRTLVEYNGSGNTSVGGLASGPSGLYFTGLYSDDPAAGPTGSQAKVYRVRYAPAENTAPPVTVYQHADFLGAAQSLSLGLHEAVKGELSAVGNDAISSLRVSAGYRVVVCAHDSLGRINTSDLGYCRFYGPGNHAYVGDELNDAISLISVQAGPSVGNDMSAFLHRDFGGRGSSFGIGHFEAVRQELGAVGNDAITSLRIVNGRRSIVCEHDSLGRTDVGSLGLCRFYGPGAYPYVGQDLNDKISLIIVSN